MRLPFFSTKRHGPALGQGVEWARSLFAKFQRIQKHNTKALEVMAEMDRALGGEYIFDRAFLDSSVRELSGLAHQVVYSLNAMSRNRYANLFDRYQSIRDVLDDILAGGLGPLGSSLALPYSILGAEMEPLAGALNVCLAEARNRLDIAAPDGFAVTVTGCRKLAEATETDFPQELAEAIDTQVKDLFERRGGPVALSVRACSSDMNFDIPAGAPSDEVFAACRLALAGYSAPAPDSDKGPLSLAVHETVSGQVAGSVSVLVTNEFPSGLFCITASTLKNPGPAENYLLRRTYPFDPVTFEITAKPFEIIAKPFKITAKPVEITAKPVEITAKPVEITAKPVEITSGSRLLDASISSRPRAMRHGF